MFEIHKSVSTHRDRTKQVAVDPEFSALIPPLTADENKILREKLRAEGMREPLLTWNGLLIDGHHRLVICQEESLTYESRELEFASRADVMMWMIAHACGRRNLNTSQRAMLAAKLANLDFGANQHHVSGSNDDGYIEGTSREVPSSSIADAAKKMEVSRASVERAKVIIRRAAPEVAKAVTDGKVTVKEAVQIAKLPIRQQIVVAQKGPEAIKAAAKAVRLDKPAKVESTLPESVAIDEALDLCKRLMAAVHAICGDPPERQPMKCGAYLIEHRQDLEKSVREIRRLFTFGRPYAVCPYCTGEDKKCTGCNGVRWVSKRIYDAAPSEMRDAVKGTVLT